MSKPSQQASIGQPQRFVSPIAQRALTFENVQQPLQQKHEVQYAAHQSHQPTNPVCQTMDGARQAAQNDAECPDSSHNALLDTTPNEPEHDNLRGDVFEMDVDAGLPMVGVVQKPPNIGGEYSR